MLQEQSASELSPVFERCPDYEALHRVLRNRAQELPITRNAIDEASGCPSGFCGKALAGKFVKRFGQRSLFDVFHVLGLEIIVADSPEAIARSQKLLARFAPRNEASVRWNNKARASASRPKKSRSKVRKRAA